MMQVFRLNRTEDETGVSGTGIVAEGVVFTDGSCAMRWLTDTSSTAIYRDIGDLLTIHGHNGKTKLRFVQHPYDRGRHDCAQDDCENVPFSSVGGLDHREEMSVPSYLPEDDRDPYLAGYRDQARSLYGDDWKVCSFGWAPSLVIGE